MPWRIASNQKPALGVGLREQLGEILVRKGRLDRHELAQALAESKAAELRLGEYLVRTGLVYENEVAQALADQFELPYSALERSMIDRETAQLMRADPDAILVGEIRELETAEIAMQAAMTGHLVLSSVHASSAPAALTRLRELGLGAVLVASAVTCVVAQRLVRRPCATCGEGRRILDAEVVAAGLPAGTVLHRPRGCAACGHTGCSGRVAVFESLLLDDEIRALPPGPKQPRAR